MRYRTPTVLQMEATECGAASLAMILGYWGHFEPLEKLRNECCVTRNGSKASIIVKVAQSYGLIGKGLRLETEDLKEIKSPMIIYWNFNHFLVYEGQNSNGTQFYLNDPATGPRIVDLEQFEKSFTGVALTFEPSENFQKNNPPKGVLASLFKMMSGLKGLLAMAVSAGVLLVLPGLAIPALMQSFVDNVLVDGADWLYSILLCLIVSIIFQVILTSIVQLALRRGQLQISVNRTVKMIDYIFKLPISFFGQRGNADIQNRITLNVKTANTTFGVLAENLIKLFTAAFFLILMLLFSIKLTFISVLFVAIDIAFLYLLVRKRQIVNQSLLSIKLKMLNFLIIGLGSLESLKASGREDSLFSRWMDNISQYNNKKLEYERLTIYYSIIPKSLNAISALIILTYGASLVINDELTVGELFAYQVLSMAFVAPFAELLLKSTDLQTLKADIDRINDIYSYKADGIFAQKEKYPDSEVFKDYGILETKNLTFTYGFDNDYVVKDFSLKLNPGKRIAIVGASGSGKSTVAKLLSGIIKPTSGELLLNNRPYSDYTHVQFSYIVSVVDQSINLFSGSILDNLTMFSKSYSYNELFDALKDAKLTQELSAKGSILGQALTDGGKNFSGGQRQRLEIARVLAYNTPIVILDEATSALDSLTEEQIDLALRRRQISTIIIAHRLSTIRNADEIIVLNKGEIVERGTHSELMALNGNYASLMRLEEGNTHED